jgi:hypothetical protein
MPSDRVTVQMRADLARFAEQHKAALDALAKEDPTPSDDLLDFELGAACDLNDTDCEACQ